MEWDLLFGLLLLLVAASLTTSGWLLFSECEWEPLNSLQFPLLFICLSSFSFNRFVGVGEASFISLAAPYIDDSAPAARVCFRCWYSFGFFSFVCYDAKLVDPFVLFFQKNLWLGLFYMCIPAGVALGYVFGGYVSIMFDSFSVYFKCSALYV